MPNSSSTTTPPHVNRRHGRGRGSSRSTRFEHLLGLQSDRSLEELEADLAASKARIAEINSAAGITEDMTIFEKREARERYHESQVKQRCRQCGSWVPREALSRNLKFCKPCIAVHRAEQSAYVNRPLPTASANPDLGQLASEAADLFPVEEPVVVDEPMPSERPEQWNFECPGCQRRIPCIDKTQAYVRIGCRVVATVAICQGCSSGVALCTRG